jgi:uracil-DNA glycosylase family 4
MENKKSPYSNCSECPLKDQPCVIAEKNVKKYSEVELMVLAEAPAKNEVAESRPLSPNGAAGAIFRAALKDSKLDTENSFFSNVVLCSNIIDDRTVNPPKEAYEFCKPNWNKFIDSCKPKIILALGSSVKDAMEFPEKISALKGQIRKYRGYPVLFANHPSHVKRNGGIGSENYKEFVEHFKRVKEYLVESRKINIDEIVNDIRQQEKKIEVQESCNNVDIEEWQRH